MHTKGDQRSGCPINATVEVIGDQWSLLVLRDIMFGDRRQFRELLHGSQERIASNILADRLSRLVTAGLLTRADAGPGRKAPYSLTAAAIELVPVLAELGAWGVRHRDTTEPLRVRAELLAEGGRPMWSRFMAELRARDLGEPTPVDEAGPSVTEQLATAYREAGDGTGNPSRRQ